MSIRVAANLPRGPRPSLVDDLPAAEGRIGWIFVATDAADPIDVDQPIVGGGAISVPVMSDGSGWYPIRNQWVPPGAVAARDYINDRITNVASETVTRASKVGTSGDSSGDLSRFAVDTLRRTNLGASAAGTATNGIKNPNGEGFAAPDQTGDGWAFSLASGVTASVVRTLIDEAQGLYAIDVTIGGSSGSSSSNFIFFNRATDFAAVQGDKIVGLARLALIDGTLSTANEPMLVSIEENSGGSALVTHVPSSSLEIDGTLRPFPYEYFCVNASTVYSRFALRFISPAGVAQDWTIRIYQPAQAKNVNAIPSVNVNPAYEAGTNLATNPSQSGGGPTATLPTGWTFTTAGALAVTAVSELETRPDSDGVLRTGRRFLIEQGAGNPANSARLAYGVSVSAVQNDKIVTYVSVAQTGGSQSGVATVGLGLVERNNTTALANQNTPAFTLSTLDDTVYRRRGSYTVAQATANNVNMTVLIVPVANLAVSIELFIAEPTVDKNNDVTGLANTSAADVIEVPTALLSGGQGVTGARGAYVLRFKPGEYLSSYTIFTYQDAANSDNKVELLVTGTTGIKLRITRNGVADSDVTVDTGSLVAEVESAIALSWSSTVKVCLNGNPVVDSGAGMPFSGRGRLFLGQVEGRHTKWSQFASPPSDADLRRFTASSFELVLMIFSGQSWLAGSNGQISVADADPTCMLPAPYVAFQDGAPREFMFRMPRVALTAYSGSTSDDVRGGRDRIGGSALLADQVWPTPIGLRRMRANQFITSTLMFTAGEAAVRYMSQNTSANRLFLTINGAIGGIGLPGRLKVPTVPQSNGHTQYDDIMTGIDFAVEQARLQGWTTRTAFWFEDPDYGNGDRDTADVVADFATQRTTSLADIVATVGSDVAVHHITYCAPNTRTARMNGCVSAALDLDADTDSGWTVSCDPAWIANKDGTKLSAYDCLHWGATMAGYVGEEFGRTALSLLQDEDPDPLLLPTSVSRSGDTYTIAYDVPLQEVADVQERADKGLEILDGDGVALTITGVTVGATSVVATVSGGTGEAGTVRGGLLGFDTSGPDFDFTERRGLPWARSAGAGSYMDGTARIIPAAAFERTVT